MRTLVVAALVIAMALAGCASNKGGDGDDGTGTNSGSDSKTASGTKSGTKSGTSTGTTSGTGTGAPGPRIAELSADVTNGTAPLGVNFTLNASAGSTQWRLAFGDGNAANGTTLPAAANHTYVAGGNFTATLTVSFPDGNATASVNVTLAVPAGNPAPEVTHFEFGEVSGCFGDAHAINPAVPINCVSFQGGPDASGIDGHWLALDERYWGMTLTTTMDEPTHANPDSDCYFFAADAKTELASGSNGGGLCLGVVPAGTAWLFLYPWALPATAMTADFA